MNSSSIPTPETLFQNNNDGCVQTLVGSDLTEPSLQAVSSREGHRDFDSYSMKDTVFIESGNTIIAIGQNNNITYSKLDRFLINNNIRNRSKARTKEQNTQVLLKYLQLETELFCPLPRGPSLMSSSPSSSSGILSLFRTLLCKIAHALNTFTCVVSLPFRGDSNTLHLPIVRALF